MSHFYVHESLDPIPDTEILWRYLSISKFISLLVTKSLYFSPISDFSDEYEGHFTRATIDALLERHNLPEAEVQYGSVESTKAYIRHVRKIREKIYANCWHINKGESDAMWQLYLKSGEGVAIRTTAKRLQSSVHPAPKKYIAGGKIRYIDFDSETINDRNLLSVSTYKRISFQHESEYRLLFIDEGANGGVQVPCDIYTLMEDVYAPPFAEPWLLQVVDSLLEKYEIKIKVKQSKISIPVFEV